MGRGLCLAGDFSFLLAVLKIGSVELAHVTAQECVPDEESRRRVSSAFPPVCVWQHASFLLEFVWLKPQVPYSSCQCAQCLYGHHWMPSKQHLPRLSEGWRPPTEAWKIAGCTHHRYTYVVYWHAYAARSSTVCFLLDSNNSKGCLSQRECLSPPPSQEILPVSMRKAR